jgi:hypothetical protein
MTHPAPAGRPASPISTAVKRDPEGRITEHVHRDVDPVGSCQKQAKSEPECVPGRITRRYREANIKKRKNQQGR